MKETIIPIGPYHPLQEEPDFFTLTVEGERVVNIDVRVGYNHRGIEKLSEMKTFDQSTFVIERICGICSTSHPFAYTRALEDIISMEVPRRARYIRTIIAEGEADTLASAVAGSRRTLSGATKPSTCGRGSCARKSWTSWRCSPETATTTPCSSLAACGGISRPPTFRWRSESLIPLSPPWKCSAKRSWTTPCFTPAPKGSAC